MLISVIIPCHNGIEDTRGCLESLHDQCERNLEILLVDNGSWDGSDRLDCEFPGLKVLRQGRNLGFSGGVNQGLRAATGDRLVILNNDTLVGEQMISRLKAGLDADANIAIVAPVSNHVKGTARINVGTAGADAADRRGIEAVLDSHYGTYLQDRCTLSGLCMMFRPSLIEEIGLFDERFGTGNFEDDDFCLRAKLRGHRLAIVRNAFVHHHGQRTFTAMGIDYSKALKQRGQAFADKWSGLAAGRAILAQIDDDFALAAKESYLALEESPLWADAFLNIARHELDRDLDAAAEAHLHDFLERCPNHGEAHLLRACALIGMDQETEGRALFASTIKDESLCEDELAVGLFHLARILIKRGKSVDAITHLQAILEFAPDRPEALNLLGIAYLTVGDQIGARSKFDQAGELGEENALRNLELLEGRWR